MGETIGLGREPLAPFGTDHRRSRGRLVPEPESSTRTAFQRDRDRIVHSTAFRRLKHKTQVFVSHEGDHYRTRLTHTIEMSQIARAFARALRLDEDLTEAIALVHDFGHTPFGHAGERALEGAMAAFGGFDHNAQGLRIVTELERRYAGFDGLNLSFETLEGLVKHNGPLVGPKSGHAAVPKPILDFDRRFPLDLHRFATLEAQAAAISDDIAYVTHDLDDGLRAGLIDVEDLRSLELAGSIFEEVRRTYPELEPTRVVHEIMRRHITAMVEDVIANTQARLDEHRPADVEAVRDAAAQFVDVSPAMRQAMEETRGFLFERVYRSRDVMSVMQRAERIVRDLFERYHAEPEEMAKGWGGDPLPAGSERRARRVADFIAGMTDTYALAEHRRLFDGTPDSR